MKSNMLLLAAIPAAFASAFFLSDAIGNGQQAQVLKCDPRKPVNLLPGSATALHVIDQPGSYYLIDDIQGVTGLNGIEILSADVTLDLNGFVLKGVADAESGIKVRITDGDLEISNGSIVDWGGDGVDFDEPLGIAGSGSAFCRCVSLRSSRNRNGYNCRAPWYVVHYKDCAGNRNRNCGYNHHDQSYLNCYRTVAIANANAGYCGGGSARYYYTLSRLNGGSGYVSNGPVNAAYSTSDDNLRGWELGSGSVVCYSTAQRNQRTGFWFKGSHSVGCYLNSRDNFDGYTLNSNCSLTYSCAANNLVYATESRDNCRVAYNNFSGNSMASGSIVNGNSGCYTDNIYSNYAVACFLSGQRNIVIRNYYSNNGQNVADGGDDKVGTEGCDPTTDNSHTNWKDQ